MTATAMLLFLLVCGVTAGLSSPAGRRAFLVTGANKGQGLALCQRILSEYDDTFVFLCSRKLQSGTEAASKLPSSRVEVVQLDVTDDNSVKEAANHVQEKLGDATLAGVVSNAGILWGYSLSELLDVCTVGVYRVLEAFLPLVDPQEGRVVVVSSGLGPLMHGFSSPKHQEALKEANWDTLVDMMEQCRQVEKDDGGPEAFEKIGFPGGPFAEAVPEFHMYGLAKMFADSYMLSLARAHPNLAINSCDPGLVYTDLIDRMPRYQGKPIEETNAKTPAQGVEASMRLLFGGSEEGVVEGKSGLFYAVNKEGLLVSSAIDKRPDT